VEKYQRAVFNIALYKSRNYFDAEDLSQDIFLAAFKSLSSLKAPDNFGGWLFGIAYNRCHKWFRRERNKIVKIHELERRAVAAERERLRAAPEPPALSSSPSPSSSEDETGSDQFLSDGYLRLPADVGRPSL